MALELDSEKLTYYAKSRIIRWVNISNLYYAGDGGRWNDNYTISFSMNNPDEDLRLRTNFIDGIDKEICDTILAYYEKYKQ